MNDGVIWVFGGKIRVFLKNPRIHEKLEEYEVNFKGFPDNLPKGKRPGIINGENFDYSYRPGV